MAVTDWYIYREKPLNSEVIFTLYTYTLFYRKKKKKEKKIVWREMQQGFTKSKDCHRKILRNNE